MELLTKVLSKLPGTPDETYVQSLIDDAEILVLNQTNQEELNPVLGVVVAHIAVLAFNRKGTEHLQSESYSGVSSTFMDDLTPTMRTVINRNTKIAGW